MTNRRNRRNRPTGIHIENCEDVTLSNNIGIGDMDFIVAQNSKNVKGSGNKHIIPNQKTVSATKRWFEKPFGIVFLGLVVTVIGGGVLYYLGWL